MITGAGRGLGHACALAFSGAGADVALLDIGHDLPGVPYPLASSAQLARTAGLCEERGAAVLALECDVRDPGAVRAAVDQSEDRFGSVDVLVNCAGIAAPSGKSVHDISEGEWALMLDVDLSGAWRMIKAVGPAMAARKSGSIINVSSTAGLVGYRNFAGYVVAKHGMIGLTRAVALDYAPFKIRVNALCPGSVRDDPEVDGRMLSEIARSLEVEVDEHEKVFLQAQPMNELIEPGSIAAAALWLADDGSRQVTGSVLTVDAGFTAR